MACPRTPQSVAAAVTLLAVRICHGNDSDNPPGPFRRAHVLNAWGGSLAASPAMYVCHDSGLSIHTHRHDLQHRVSRCCALDAALLS